jgi:hypothetical protein
MSVCVLFILLVIVMIIGSYSYPPGENYCGRYLQSNREFISGESLNVIEPSIKAYLMMDHLTGPYSCLRLPRLTVDVSGNYSPSTTIQNKLSDIIVRPEGDSHLEDQVSWAIPSFGWKLPCTATSTHPRRSHGSSSPVIYLWTCYQSHYQKSVCV